MTDGVPVLFIGGLGRSGSTLVDRILGQTPGVCSVGELVFLWERGLLADERCGCGEAFSACPFWTEVGMRSFGGWDRIDPAVMLQRQRAVDRNRFIPLMRLPRASPTYRRRLRSYSEALRRVYASVAAISGAALVVDSSKHASTATLLAHVPGIAPRVAHLVRDPRGVAWSWAKRVDRPDADVPSQMARVGTVRIAARWASSTTPCSPPRAREGPCFGTRTSWSDPSMRRGACCASAGSTWTTCRSSSTSAP